MPQAVVAVISAVATVGFTTAAAAGISITAMATATAFAIGAGVIAVGALAANKLISSMYEIPKMDTDASRQRTVRSTIEPQKIIYGEALVSGPIAFVGVYGSKNRVLAHAVALAGHEVNAITDIHFDNEVIDNSLIDGNGFVTSGTFGPIGGNQFNDQGGVNFGFNICKINKHLGAAGQTVDADLDSAFGSIDSSHKGTGIAYITTHWLLKDDSQEIWDKYTPTNIKALVEGRKVYDPRTELTAYSDNPALCVADYLTNTEFGMGISSSRIDWTSITNAANACDVLVDTPDGTDSQKRFTCNGVLFATDTHKTNINKLLSSMNGLLTYTNGTFVIRAGVYEAPTVSLNENDLIGGVSVKTSVERSDRFNTITGTFIDPTQNHKATEFPEVFTTAARDRDNGNVLTKNIQLPMTNDRYMAQRIAHKLVQQSDQQKVVTFPTNLSGMDVAVGDRVEISLSEFGWVDKVFICLGWTLNDSGNGGINLILREDDAGSYADPAVGEYSTITATGQIVEGFRGVPDPQNLIATSFNNYIQLNWTNPDNMNDVLFIEVFASPVSAWSETFTATSGQTVFVYDRDFTVDDTFDVKLDGVALVQGTDFTVDLETKTLTLTTGAAAGDILEIFNRIKIGETDGTQFVHDAATPADSISPDDTRYYWIRARAYSTGETALSVSDRNPDNDVSTVFATVGRVDFLNVSGDVVQTGDTSRTLIDRLSDIISPDDFGAVGDGIEDDTEALKALAAWVYSISTELDTSYRKGHVSIRFPARRLYKITDTIDFGGEAKDDGSGAVQTGLRVHFDFNNCEIAPAPHPDTGVVSSALRMWGDNSSWKNLKVNYARYCTVDEVYQYQPTAIFVGPDPADMSTRFASNSFSTYENIQVFDAYNGFELEADTVALFKVTWRQCDAKKCLNWGYYLNSQPVVGASTTNTFQQCHVAARLVTADYGRVRIDEDFTATEGQSVFTYTQEFLSSDDPIVVVEGETFTRSLFANYLEIGRTYLIINLGDADWNAIAGTTGVTYSVGDIITPVAQGAANTTGRVGDFSVDLDLKTITLAVPRTSGDQVNIYGVYECIQTHVPDSTNKAGLGANWQDYWFSLTNAESAPATTYPDWTTSTTRYYEDGKGWYLYGFGSTGFIGQCAIDGTNNRVAGNGITCLQFGLTISGGFHWEAPKLIANDSPLMLVQNASLNIDHMYIPAPYFANEGNNVFIGGINSRMITVNEMRVVQAQMARGNRYLIDASGFGTVTTGAGINPEEVKNAPSSNVHGAYDVQRNITARPMRRDLGQDFGGSNSTVTPATWQSGTTFSHNVTSGGSFTLNLTKDPERGSEYRAFCYNSAGGATANVTASSTDGATIIGPTVAKGGETLVAYKAGNSFWYTRIEYNQHYGDFVDVDALVVGQNYRIYSLGNTTQTQWNTIAGTTGVTYAVNDIITPVQQGGAGSTGRVGELYIGDTKLESVTNTLPSASRYEGHVIRVGDDASYGDVLAFSDGTDWLRSNDLNPVNSTGVTYIDTTNGRLGISTSSPAEKLDIQAGSIRLDNTYGLNLMVSADTVYAGGLYADGGNNTRLWSQYNDLIIETTGAHPVQFRVNGSEGMRLDASGRLGINNSSPVNQLSVGAIEISGGDQLGTVGIKSDANDKALMLQENVGTEQWEIGVDADGDLNFYNSGSTTPSVQFLDNGGVDVTGEITADGIALGDNQKATFGASDDLQIYHDGSNSYIDDAGVGDLAIRGNNITLGKYTGEIAIKCVTNGATEIYHDNSNLKLATTSTGIDVTGTVTADGLTVDGNISLTASGTERFAINKNVSPLIEYRLSTNNYHLSLESVGASQGDIKLYTGTSSATQRANFASNGDISFYEDTGTTAKFFWDASAESLGIGTTSPDSSLKISKATGSATISPVELNINTTTSASDWSTTTAWGRLKFTSDDVSATNPRAAIAAIAETTGGGNSAMLFETMAAERMRLDSSGRLGLGTTSPAYKLVVSAGGASGIEFGPAYSGTANLVQHYSRSGGVYVDAVNVAAQHRFFIGGTERARLDSSGNLGINTLSPATNLEVVGVIRASDGTEYTEVKDYGIDINRSNAYLRPTSAFNGTANLNIGGAGNIWNIVSIESDNSFQVTDGTDKRFEVQAGADAIFYDDVGVEGMRWDSSAQRLGIGTSSPQTPLHVEGLTRISEGGETAFYGGNYVRVFNSQAYQFRNSAGSAIAQINLSGNSYFNGGNVGIGTSSPTEKLDVNGTVKANFGIIGGNQTSTSLTVEASDTAGAPARTAIIRMKGYEGRGLGTFYEDISYSGEEWFAGMPYAGGFNAFQIGYDQAGGQAEYAANSIARFTSSGDFQMGTTTVIDSSRNLTNIGTISSGAITTSGTVTANGAGASTFYALQLSRSSSGIVTPDIWGTNGTFVIGTSASVEAVGFSGANATFYGTISIAGTTVIDSSRNLTNIGTLNGGTPWTSANDGSGSGLDADLLDGVHGSSFLRGDIADTASQRIQFAANNTNNWDTIATGAGSQGALEVYNGGAGNDAFMTFHVGGDFACYFGLDGGINDLAVGGWSMGANSYRIWHQGNDGAGSGLDADLLDGLNSAENGNSVILKTASNGYLNINNWIRIGATTGLYNSGGYYLYPFATYGWRLRNGGSTTTSSISLDVSNGSRVGWIYANDTGQGFLTTGGSWRFRIPTSGSLQRDATYTIWDSGNDGSGSGLDADKVDGLQASQFLRSDTSDTMNGNLTITNDLTAGESFFGATSYKVRINSSSSTGIVEFNSTNGVIRNTGTVLGLAASSTQIVDVRAAGMQPTTDNVSDLGASSKRWDNIYATNGTIQTSDGNEKQDVEELSEAELRVAQSIKGLIRKFRFKSAVADKGDDARIHFGVIAQDVQAAFEAEGLDAGQYGCFCADVDEDGNERLGIRYDELLAFVITAL